MARTGLGIEVRDTSIRIKFVLNGETIRERLTVNGVPLAPTPANLKYATKVAADVRKKIAQDLFEFADFFPESPRAKLAPASTFGKLAGQWLKSKGQLEAATLDQYTNAIKIWEKIFGADTAMDKLTYQVLSSKIGGHPWASGKSANNYLIVLRGVFAFEYNGRRTADNPMVGITNLPVVKKLPDPLTGDERDAILASMTEKYDPRVAAYFAFAFYTGMRPEEMIALRWSDIDMNSNTARIQRVRTFRGTERDGSKTHAERDVDLVSRARDALKVMRPFTFLKPDAEVFESPTTGKAWYDERSQRDNFWTPTLKRLGIRHRRAYNTRHTYATSALMAGVNPAYIARQLGHANTKMLFEKYARWIDGADKGQEKLNLERALGGAEKTKDELQTMQFVPSASQ